MKAAIFHALSDIFQSIGLIISASFIFFFGSDHGDDVHEWNNWHYFDPISTYVFSIVVIISTYPVVRNCYCLMMESTPDRFDLTEMKEEFEKIYGVVDVHDLHLWDLRAGKTIMIAHIMSKKGTERDVLTLLTELCRRRKIYHSTFQIEEQDLQNDDNYILCHHDIH